MFLLNVHTLYLILAYRKVTRYAMRNVLGPVMSKGVFNGMRHEEENVIEKLNLRLLHRYSWAAGPRLR